MKIHSHIHRVKGNKWQYEGRLELTVHEAKIVSEIIRGNEIVAKIFADEPRWLKFILERNAFGNSGSYTPDTDRRLVEYTTGGVLKYKFNNWIFRKLSSRTIKLDILLEGFWAKASESQVRMLKEQIDEYSENLKGRINLAKSG